MTEDIESEGRWHLGMARTLSGVRPGFLSGQEMQLSEPISIPTTHVGRSLDFSLTSFGVPVVSSRLAEIMSKIAHADVQFFDASIDEKMLFKVLNVTKRINCLDERRSEFLKWKPEDGRPDKLGSYRQVTKLIIDPALVPSDVNMFRICGWEIAIIVRASVKKSLRNAINEIVFLDVVESGSEMSSAVRN